MSRQIVIAALTAAVFFLFVAPAKSDSCPSGVSQDNAVVIYVQGVSDGTGWAWCVRGPGYEACNLNVNLPAGSDSIVIAAAIVASINAAGCPGISASIIQPVPTMFLVSTTCYRWPVFCMGPAGEQPTHCFTWERPDTCFLDANFMQPWFIDCFEGCGDANADGVVTISDAVWLINYVFSSSAPGLTGCGANANGDCVVSISDAVAVIKFTFAGGQLGMYCYWPD